MQKKILIPGGQYSDWALVNAAHRLGLYVITSGYHENDPAHKFSDKYIKADYADKEAMLAIAQKEHIDYMCSNANDFGMLSTAYVCEKLGLPGHDSYETTCILHHKDTFKPIAKKLGLHSPAYEIFQDKIKAIEYIENSEKKVIIKPSDNVGSNGVSKDEICKSVDYAFSNSKIGSIIVEEFVEGFYAPVTSMIINKEVVAFFANGSFIYNEGKRLAPEFPVYGRQNGRMYPCPYMDEFAPSIIDDFNKLAKDLNLVDGKLHCELIITPDHNAYIFDNHRRMSGFTEPWPEWNMTTGMNWEDWIVKAECGMDLSDFPIGIKQNPYFHLRNIYAPKDGHIKKVVFDEYLTSHIYPEFNAKEFCMYDIVVTDHIHQPIVSCFTDFGSNEIRGNYLTFKFDTEKECEFISNPENSKEFYKHIIFEYNEI